MTNKIIPKEDLIIGQAYHGDGRNFTYALWDGKVFQGIRYKFGSHFIDEEMYYGDDPHYGTFKPLELLLGKNDKFKQSDKG